MAKVKCEIINDGRSVYYEVKIKEYGIFIDIVNDKILIKGLNGMPEELGEVESIFAKIRGYFAHKENKHRLIEAKEEHRKSQLKSARKIDENMFVTSDGRVGLGTHHPNERLHITIDEAEEPFPEPCEPCEEPNEPRDYPNNPTVYDGDLVEATRVRYVDE